jgi:hypothetical protein
MRRSRLELGCWVINKKLKDRMNGSEATGNCIQRSTASNTGTLSQAVRKENV